MKIFCKIISVSLGINKNWGLSDAIQTFLQNNKEELLTIFNDSCLPNKSLVRRASFHQFSSIQNHHFVSPTSLSDQSTPNPYLEQLKEFSRRTDNFTLKSIFNYLKEMLEWDYNTGQSSGSYNFENVQQNIDRNLHWFSNFKLNKEDFNKLAMGNFEVLMNMTNYHLLMEKNLDNLSAWASVKSILENEQYEDVLSYVPLSKFFPTLSREDEIPIFVKHSNTGFFPINFVMINLDKLNLINSNSFDYQKSCFLLKWIISYLQIKSGLSISDKSEDSILENYLTSGVMVLIVGDKFSRYSFPFGVSIGCFDNGNIQFKAQYILPNLKGKGLSILMDQLILKSLITQYTMTYPLTLSARSTTLAALVKLPGFLESLHRIAQFMIQSNANFNCDEPIYKKLRVLIMNYDDGISKVRNFLTFINRLSLGDAHGDYQTQIKLYEILVTVLSGNYENEELIHKYEGLRQESTSPPLDIQLLGDFLESGNSPTSVIFSPYRLLALCQTIDSFQQENLTQSFDKTHVTTILTNYNQLLTGSIISVELEDSEIPNVSDFFLKIHQLYSQFKLRDIKVHFGFDLMILFAGHLQDYDRVHKWNMQLLIQRYLCCFSLTNKSLLSAKLGSYFGRASGSLTEGFLQQLLLSGVQTGAYIEHDVLIHSPENFTRYFKSRSLPVGYFSQSYSFYTITSAMLEIALLVLDISCKKSEKIMSDNESSTNKMTCPRLSKIMSDLNESSTAKISCFSGVLSAVTSCINTQRRPIFYEWPNDKAFKLIQLNTNYLHVTQYPWKNGWDSPFHALYGSSTKFGDAPEVINPESELYNWINSSVNLIMGKNNRILEDTDPNIKRVTNYLLKNNILTTNTLEMKRECEEYINFTSIKKENLRFNPDELASFFILHEYFSNENSNKGLCIFDGETPSIFPPINKQEFEPSNAIFIKFDKSKYQFARLNARIIQKKTFDFYDNMQRKSLSGSEEYISDVYNLLNRGNALLFNTKKSVNEAIAFYLRHHDNSEFEFKLTQLKENLRSVEKFINQSSNFNLDVFFNQFSEGPVCQVLFNAFSNMDGSE